MTHAESPEPLLNTRFRVEIDGLAAGSVVEVILPEARIVREGEKPDVRYGALTLRRTMTASSDWFRWWDNARGARRPEGRRVAVVLMDRSKADVQRWTYEGAIPAAYHVSPLNSLRSELLVETLELSVSGFSLG